MTVISLTFNLPPLSLDADNRAISSESNNLHQQILKTRFDWENYSASNFNLQDAIDEVKNLFLECRKENWDGYFAQPISIKSLSHAIKFLISLPSWLEGPSISVEPDGEIEFEWRGPNNKVFSVSIGENNTITYAGIMGDGEEISGQTKFDDSIPQKIIQNISETIE